MRRKVQLSLVRVRLLLTLHPGKVTDWGRLSHATPGLLLCGLNVLKLSVKLRMEGVRTSIKIFNEPCFSYWAALKFEERMHHV